MGSITVCTDGDRKIDDVAEIRAFLEPFGIWYERWDVAGRIGADATSEQILEAYAPEIERLKERGGYVTADVIDVTAATPNLETLLEKFRREHTHAEDEVRFIVRGRGLFHIHGERDGESVVFAIRVEGGDLINVPAGTRHWFNLCDERDVRAIRLFVDPAGWTPEYLDDGVHAGYAPVCWGPTHIAGSGA